MLLELEVEHELLELAEEDFLFIAIAFTLRPGLRMGLWRCVLLHVSRITTCLDGLVDT